MPGKPQVLNPDFCTWLMTDLWFHASHFVSQMAKISLSTSVGIADHKLETPFVLRKAACNDGPGFGSTSPSWHKFLHQAVCWIGVTLDQPFLCFFLAVCSKAMASCCVRFQASHKEGTHCENSQRSFFHMLFLAMSLERRRCIPSHDLWMCFPLARRAHFLQVMMMLCP